MDVVYVKKETDDQEGENIEYLNPQPLSVFYSAPISSINTTTTTTTESTSIASQEDSNNTGGIIINGKRSSSSVSNGEVSSKKPKSDNPMGFVLPVGFLEPLSRQEVVVPLAQRNFQSQSSVSVQSCKQFWKAGDYEGSRSRTGGDSSISSDFGGMSHVRVHPKFLHSNATSHKWALGAFAELLDNAVDEACNGATFVNIDMLENKKDGSRMLLFEDNGGGMSPETMRHCMSLGYSVKSKLANTIGQYGNGFKTSTMRLGADVIVFSRCQGKDGGSPTQTIGLLSYTFLTSTGKEDIVVPMLDYEKKGQNWSKMIRSSSVDWDRNVETIVQWSPYSSEAELLQQFYMIKDQGTRVVVYNLWEDEDGELELDFDTDQEDIQMRGVNRDEKNIEMAKKYKNSRHFLTYRHSLRSYSSILYLRRPPGFRIILRGKDVEHHCIDNDMMFTQKVTYRPTSADGSPKDSDMVALVTVGFVKDAKDHIDIQGFNVYHKNRLIKPFWRVWNAAGSNGRGIIGVLEANFVEPAHDKQGFERTTVLSRLENRLQIIQKSYWSGHCHKVGYARVNRKKRDDSPEYITRQQAKDSSSHSAEILVPALEKCNAQIRLETTRRQTVLNGNKSSSLGRKSSSQEEAGNNDIRVIPSEKPVNGSVQTKSSVQKPFALNGSGQGLRSGPVGLVELKNENCELKNRVNLMEKTFSAELKSQRDRRKMLEEQVHKHSNAEAFQLELNNNELKNRLKKLEESHLLDLQTERERHRLLEAQLEKTNEKLEEMNNEQEALIQIFSEERTRRDTEEETLRKKITDASNTIGELIDRATTLQRMQTTNPVCKTEKE